jgi:fibronectin type 3 domain-containing protein
VYRSTGGNGSFDLTNLIGASSSTSYTDKDLSAGTAYYYKISASWVSGNGFKEGPQSSVASATTGSGPPGVPANVTATAVSPSSITISWPAVPDAGTYQVYRSTGSSVSYIQLGGWSSSTSYTDTWLIPDTEYHYKVAASNGYGVGSQSSAVSAETFSPSTLPGVPTDVWAMATSASNIRIGWPQVLEATEYRVYSSTTEDGVYERRVPYSTITSTSFLDTAVLPSTEYYYKVSACNICGESSLSSAVLVTTNSLSGAPGVPTDVTATVKTESSATVSWSEVSGATEYKVYRSTSSAGTYSQIGSPSSTSYTDTGLTYGETYYYRVSAFNTNGESARSPVVSVTIAPPAAPPATPTGLSIHEVTVTEISMSWSEVYWATGYKVYRSTSSAGTYTEITSTPETSYVNRQLPVTTLYYYKVSAYNSYGESALSSAVYATTKDWVLIPHRGEITVQLQRVIDYWPSSWSGVSLRIVVNGATVQSMRLDPSKNPNTYRFTPANGARVQIYYSSSFFDYNAHEYAFAVYYTNDPPSPAFNPEQWASNDTGKLLLYGQCGSFANEVENMLLGSFIASQ